MPKTEYDGNYHLNIAQPVVYENFIANEAVDFETLDTAVSKILRETEKQIELMIDHFEMNNDEGAEIDTVDLDSKFEVLHDYCRDYINE